MTACSIYQIDYSLALLGKRKEDAKREVRWRYGHTDEESGDAKEHEVVFTWSLKSGERTITFDGYEEFYNKKSGASVFDHKWKAEVGHELQLVATHTPPNNVAKNFRCYELLINDKSFFTYPRAGESMERNEYVQTSDSGPSSILDILYPERSAFEEKEEYVVVFEPSSPTRPMYRETEGAGQDLLL